MTQPQDNVIFCNLCGWQGDRDSAIPIHAETSLLLCPLCWWPTRREYVAVVVKEPVKRRRKVKT